MRIIVIGLTIILTLIFESTYFQYIRINGIMPNIMLIIIVTYSILRGSKEGAILGIAAGFTRDLFFGYVIGMYTLLFFYVGLLAGYFNKDFYKDNYMLPLAIITAIDFIYGLMIYIFTYLFRGRLDIGYYTLNVIIPEVVYTSVFALVIYRTLFIVNEKIELHEAKYKKIH